VVAIMSIGIEGRNHGAGSNGNIATHPFALLP
jgi:hypothetical protein